MYHSISVITASESRRREINLVNHLSLSECFISYKEFKCHELRLSTGYASPVRQKKLVKHLKVKTRLKIFE